MTMTEFFYDAASREASDIFIVAGKALCYMHNGAFVTQGQMLLPADTEAMIQEIYDLAKRDIGILKKHRDDDFSFAIASVGRFRVNAFMQRGSMAAVLRVISFTLPDGLQLGVLPQILDLHKRTKGLVLVTGPAGSGKTTTLNCIIDQINKTRMAHIITLEDPLEYLHRHDKSIVTQREIGMDTESYASGLRAALRESPDVILLGEMRDYETIAIAMSAAETGQLVLSSLHTLGAANTIDRIIDVFPPNQQQQIRIQLSMILHCVISQQLIPSPSGKPVVAFEVMFCNAAIRNMIREAKMHQLNSVIRASSGEGMISMDDSLYQLYSKKLISEEDLLIHCFDPNLMMKKLGR